MAITARTLLLTAVLATCAATSSHAGSLQCQSPEPDGTQACTIDPAIDSKALCNDGSQPAFWIRPGRGAGLNRWVIWLQGGGECVDDASCTARASSMGSLLTSNGFTASQGLGVLSPDPATNPLLFNANTVLIHYCSSDDWSGNYASRRSFSASDPATWNFQGRRIALAAIESLRELPRGLAQAKQILLGGSSAGGLGIVATANDILPILPAADTRLANDAGFTIDIGQYDPTAAAPHVYPGQPDAFQTFFTSALHLWHGRGDARCDAAAQTAPQHVACYNTSLVMQKTYIGLPSFVTESRLDTAQLTKELCWSISGPCTLPTDQRSQAGKYATAFAVKMATALTGAGTPATYSVFSPDTYLHTMLDNGTAYTTKYRFPGASLTPRNVFTSWLKAPNGARLVDIGNAPGVSAPTKPR